MTNLLLWVGLVAIVLAMVVSLLIALKIDAKFKRYRDEDDARANDVGEKLGALDSLRAAAEERAEAVAARTTSSLEVIHGLVNSQMTVPTHAPPGRVTHAARGSFRSRRSLRRERERPVRPRCVRPGPR